MPEQEVTHEVVEPYYEALMDKETPLTEEFFFAIKEASGKAIEGIIALTVRGAEGEENTTHVYALPSTAGTFVMLHTIAHTEYPNGLVEMGMMVQGNAARSDEIGEATLSEQFTVVNWYHQDMNGFNTRVWAPGDDGIAQEFNESYSRAVAEGQNPFEHDPMKDVFHRVFWDSQP